MIQILHHFINPHFFTLKLYSSLNLNISFSNSFFICNFSFSVNSHLDCLFNFLRTDLIIDFKFFGSKFFTLEFLLDNLSSKSLLTFVLNYITFFEHYFFYVTKFTNFIQYILGFRLELVKI